MKTPHRVSAAFALMLAIAALPGCKGEAKTEAVVGAEAEVGSEAALGADAFVEEHEGGTVAWKVDTDGNVKALVAGSDGKPIRENVNGTLVYKVEEETKTVPMVLDAKTNLFVAAGPKLEADLTEINYTFSVNSKPWTGALHVPVGGTAALVAGAKASAEINIPEGKVGPNGGVIQVVGKDRVELVADAESDEVRVYLLDADFNVVPVGERTITLGFVADAPRVVALASAEGGAYFTARWGLSIDPLKVTIAVKNAGVTSVALVGYRPGVRVLVGAKAPRVKVRVKTKWAAHADVDGPDVDVNAKFKGDAKAKGHGKIDVDVPDVHAKAGAGAGAGAKVKVDVKAPTVKAPSIKVQAPSISAPKVSAKAGASAKVKIH